MARLPQPGGDQDTWGDVLNDFLSQAHDTDGNLKTDSVGAAQLKPSAVASANLADASVTHTKLDSPTRATLARADSSVQTVNGKTPTSGAVSIATSDLSDLINPHPPADGEVLTYDGLAAKWKNGALSDSTAVHKGDLILDVRDHGAVGDGAADDTAAIQNTIDAAPSTGAIVYLPAGTYKISSAISLKDKITLLGAGQRTTVITQTSTTAHGLNAASASGVRFVRIEGLQLTGPNSGSGDGIHHDRSGSWGMWNWIIKDVYIAYFGGNGITMDTPILSQLDNVHTAYCTNGFVVIGSAGGTGTSTTFRGCWAQRHAQAGYDIDSLNYSAFIACATDYCGIGYYLHGCFTVSLDGCGVENPENKNTGIYTGVGFRFDGCGTISVNGSTAYMIQSVGYLVTGFSHHVHLNCVRESGAAGGTYSIRVDSGALALVTAPSLTLPTSFVGVVHQVDQTGKHEWGGASGLDTSLTRGGAGYVEVAKQLRATTDGTLPGLYSVATADGNVSLGVLAIEAAGANKRLADFRITGDTNPRIRLNASSALGAGGSITLTDGGATNTANIYHHAGILKTDADLALNTVGKGLRVKEGTNAKMGTAALVSGTVTVSNTAVTANSRIFLTIQSPGGAVGTPYVSARVSGTTFTITSTSGTDTSTVAYQIFEPA